MFGCLDFEKGRNERFMDLCLKVVDLFWNKEKRKLSVGKKKKVSENDTVRDVLGVVIGSEYMYWKHFIKLYLHLILLLFFINLTRRA